MSSKVSFNTHHLIVPLYLPQSSYCSICSIFQVRQSVTDKCVHKFFSSHHSHETPGANKLKSQEHKNHYNQNRVRTVQMLVISVPLLKLSSLQVHNTDHELSMETVRYIAMLRDMHSWSQSSSPHPQGILYQNLLVVPVIAVLYRKLLGTRKYCCENLLSQ